MNRCRFAVCLLLMLSTSVAAKNYDTTLSGTRFTLKIKDEHCISLSWGDKQRDMEFDIFHELDTSSACNKSLFFLSMNEGKLIRLNSNIFALSESNILVALAGNQATILLLGLHRDADSIYSYKNTIRQDLSPLLIYSPSIVIRKIGGNSCQFFVASKPEVFEFDDTLSFKYSTINVITSYCCGVFTSEMQFPCVLQSKVNNDVFSNDVKFYEYILGLKKIKNPLSLFKLAGY